MTGAASGVGAAVTTTLLERGVLVVGVDRNWAEGAERPGLVRVSGSVSEQSTWRQVTDEIRRREDVTLSMMVINAARLVVGNLLDLDEEEIRGVFDVNVYGAVRAVRSCLPLMLAAGGGRIVAVASVDALYAEKDLAAYCMSKGALLQLVRTLAVDFGGQGIRANAVCPGAIDTPFFRQHVEAASDPEAFLKIKTQRHPSGRILRPEDVASAVLYLLSVESLGINGAHLMVDGGLTATFDYQPPL
ncbi:SDR family NAD(P)-dependent oxidoreductase [Acrocarpospora catenulata]|uniref:SDR family NAD(P)-dependent oxidoreductase n=1 Tax=Acrocarpospora catenulata TaxID=2836182 RepID=UPI0027E165D0|nr:SDR family oxidoreductase [Acrocarpospora catenulata]